MQDNFDNFFKNNLQTEQSFDFRQDDWAAVANQLDEVMPAKRRQYRPVVFLIPLIFLLSGGLLYNIQQLQDMKQQMKDLEERLQERKAVADATTAETVPADETIAADETVLITPTASQVTSSVPTSKPSATLIKSVERPRTKVVPVNEAPSTSVDVKTTSTPAVLPVKEETTETPKPYADINVEEPTFNEPFLKPLKEEIIESTASFVAESKVQESVDKENNIKKGTRLKNLMYNITPKSYSIGAMAGAGVSPLQFTNEKDNTIDGSFSYGVKGEAMFNNHIGLVTKGEYLNQTLTYYNNDEHNIPVHTSMNKGTHLVKTYTNLSYIQASLGAKYYINPQSKFSAYVGASLPIQFQRKQSYDYLFRDDTTEESITEQVTTKRNNVIYNTVTFNGGVSYNISDNFNLFLDGTYNVKVNDSHYFTPDLFGLNIGMSYNFYM